MTDSSAASTTEARKRAARRALGLLDLTSLGSEDTEADVVALCKRATTPHGPVASVCIWPRFVGLAVRQLDGSGVPVCAVANFPAGDDDVDRAVADARSIIESGGREVDVVVPWRTVQAGGRGAVESMVAAVRRAIDDEDGDITLKAILETGELVGEELIMVAGTEALDGGADFLKTSTGKTAVSATPEAAMMLLSLVRSRGDTGRGVKVSGGIRDLATAVRYLDLADELLGPDWARANTFRFGASGLLDDILATLD